ncbi:MAG: thiolase family protein [Lactobacillus sp.]|jgi:acetyl-CoA C-acetyltransferase|nr:thiolase family protein [Lactobacillus sp.]
MTEVMVVDSVRAPIGRYGGQWADLAPETLGAPLIAAILTRNAVPATQVDALLLGNVVGGGGNVARRVGLSSALPVTTPALTVDQQCASGLTAVSLAAAQIAAGQADLLLAGGVESTSRAPWKIARPARLYGAAPQILPRAPLGTAATGDPDMGVACDQLAKRLGISRAAQDQYAFASQQKYQAASSAGVFAPEIVPINDIDTDESPRPTTTLQRLAQLPPAFVPDGTVTAGNACPLNDGAGLCLLASRDYCRQNGLAARFVVAGQAAVGVAPAEFALGPVHAVAKLLAQTGLTLADISRIELNEAFAAQALACLQQGGWPAARVNVSGGALAFGHPFGATGAILLRRLMTELTRAGGRYGIVTMCVGGGQGVALLLRQEVAA